MEDCKQIQKMIQGFDKETLSIKNEKTFIEHLEYCDDCREEFEIYYIISYGLGDGNMANDDGQAKELMDKFDFKGLVELKLKKSRIKLQKDKKMTKKVKFCYGISNLCMIMAFIMFIIIKYY